MNFLFTLRPYRTFHNYGGSEGKNVNLVLPPLIVWTITRIWLCFVWKRSAKLFPSHHYLYAMQDTHKNKNNKMSNYYCAHTHWVSDQQRERRRNERELSCRAILIRALYIKTSCTYVAWGCHWNTHNNLIYFALSSYNIFCQLLLLLMMMVF